MTGGAGRATAEVDVVGDDRAELERVALRLL